MFVGITNTPRDYAWGSSTAISELLGHAPSGRPGGRALARHAPRLARSRSSARRHPVGSDVGLPFLLKVLAAASPLSLQAHPTLAQAVDGLRARERARHPARRPEPQLQGRAAQARAHLRAERPVPRAVRVSRRGRDRRVDRAAARARRRATPRSPAGSTGSARTTTSRAVFEWLISRGAGRRRARRRGSSSAAPLVDGPHYTLVGELAAAYPGDPGIAITLHAATSPLLAPGEVLYLPAGNIHAYVEGLGIELMAASDNVLRGGLTPKHVDVPELLVGARLHAACRCRTSRPSVVAGRRGLPAGRARLRARARDRGLRRCTLAGRRAIVLCTAGSFAVDRAPRSRAGRVVLRLGRRAAADDRRRRASCSSRRPSARSCPSPWAEFDGHFARYVSRDARSRTRARAIVRQIRTSVSAAGAHGSRQSTDAGARAPRRLARSRQCADGSPSTASSVAAATSCAAATCCRSATPTARCGTRCGCGASSGCATAGTPCPMRRRAAVAAVRVGGRLTGIAALESYGLPVPRRADRLHRGAATRPCGCARPRTVARRLTERRARLHPLGRSPRDRCSARSGAWAMDDALAVVLAHEHSGCGGRLRQRRSCADAAGRDRGSSARSRGHPSAAGRGCRSSSALGRLARRDVLSAAGRAIAACRCEQQVRGAGRGHVRLSHVAERVRRDRRRPARSARGRGEGEQQLRARPRSRLRRRAPTAARCLRITYRLLYGHWPRCVAAIERLVADRP